MKHGITEEWLKSGVFNFVFQTNFDLRLIDLAEALANPARLGKKLNEARVAKMKWAMEDGVDFPAIVVFKLPDGKYDPATGLHRIEAARQARVSVLDAYIIDEPDPYRREIVRRAINTIEGEAPPDEDNMYQIGEILQMFPDTPHSDLAAAFRIKAPAISDYLRLQGYQERAERLGIREYWSKLAQGVRLKLGRITNDIVVAAAAETLVRTKTTGAKANDIIGTLRKARSEKSALETLAGVARQYDIDLRRNKGKFGRQSRPLASRWVTVMKSLWKFLPAWSVTTLHLESLPEEDLDPDIECIDELIEQLEDVSTVLKARREKARAARSDIRLSSESIASPPAP